MLAILYHAILEAQ